MLRFEPLILVIGALALSSCEKKFDDRFEDNLEELTSEAKAIKEQADERLAAGQEADKASKQAEDTTE